MSKFDEKIQQYQAELKSFGKKSTVDSAKLTAVAKSLGPSIYLPDASLVSCSDKAERDRVKNNYLIKKLGLADGPSLDAAIQEVCAAYDSNRKLRVVFYCMLADKLGVSL